jgi:hypothetical protein
MYVDNFKDWDKNLKEGLNEKDMYRNKEERVI